jgi:hypothetical protein
MMYIIELSKRSQMVEKENKVLRKNNATGKNQGRYTSP